MIRLSSLFDLKEEGKLPDNFCLRAERRSLALARFLIDDQGVIHQELLPSLIEAFEKQGHIFYPQGWHDSLLTRHQLRVLKDLRDQPSFLRALKRFSKPLCHRAAEHLIRETLGLPSKGPLTDAHIRQAVLAACLTLLRQNVGSCFATAPAILIHEQQRDNFLKDLYDLLSTGKLKRIFGGVEHSVPLSPSFGKGDIKQINALLKSWEFTLASFSEAKMEFSHWNLYSSLGFYPEEKGGLGELIYTYIHQKLEESNEKTQQSHEEYQLAFDQLRSVEVLLRNAASQSEALRLRAEYQSRHFHMQACLEMRNKIHSRAAHYSTFFSFLIKQYEEKFPEYFQEIFDAEMQTGEQHDDSPAGFRLVYKHGRSDASVWTLIHAPEEWIQSLNAFFISVENSISAESDFEGAREDISELTTAIVTHLRTREFLETALQRMANAHKGSLLEKKPWAYTSGGTMETLVKTYYRREKALMSEKRAVESEIDLLGFIIDTLKNLNNPQKRMLMHSPTHAFILQPDQELLKEGWQDSGFTYTWIRDRFLTPRETYHAGRELSKEEQRFLVEKFLERLPHVLAHRIQRKNAFHYGSISIPAFRELMAEELPLTYVIQLDSFLYESLPLIPAQEGKEQLRRLLEEFPGRVNVSFRSPFVTTQELITTAKTLFPLVSDFDVHAYFARRAAQVGLAPPSPLLFADTNWACFYFAFLVSPATGQLELWRMDRTGSTGFPMHEWKQWLDGSSPLPWVIYTHPEEYQ